MLGCRLDKTLTILTMAFLSHTEAWLLQSLMTSLSLFCLVQSVPTPQSRPLMTSRWASLIQQWPAHLMNLFRLQSVATQKSWHWPDSHHSLLITSQQETLLLHHQMIVTLASSQLTSCARSACLTIQRSPLSQSTHRRTASPSRLSLACPQASTLLRQLQTYFKMWAQQVRQAITTPLSRSQTAVWPL